MVVEDYIEYLDEEGFHLLGKTLQGSLQNTVWVWSLAEIETLDDFVNLASVG
jgi:hypothetical protein